METLKTQFSLLILITLCYKLMSWVFSSAMVVESLQWGTFQHRKEKSKKEGKNKDRLIFLYAKIDINKYGKQI